MMIERSVNDPTYNLTHFTENINYSVFYAYNHRLSFFCYFQCSFI